MGLPHPGRVTLSLIVACTGIFLLTICTGGESSPLYRWLSLAPAHGWQAWRFVTFQFLHGDPSHLLWNMVGLYFFAPPLERAWGQRRFLAFYLVCGVVAGLSFLLLTLLWGEYHYNSLVGASGGILACLMACAILMPEMIVLIFPIRWVAVFLLAMYGLWILWGAAVAETRFGALSEAAHLGGMIAAAAWIWAPARLGGVGLNFRVKLRQGSYLRRLASEHREQLDVDRILKKIHEQGILSLSEREKRKLRQATERQQTRRNRPQV